MSFEDIGGNSSQAIFKCIIIHLDLAVHKQKHETRLLYLLKNV